VLLLDTRNWMIDDVTLYVGSLNASHIRVAEVFRDAIRQNAATIIVVHNHPSGDPAPSPEDVEITRQLARAGGTMDIIAGFYPERPQTAFVCEECGRELVEFIIERLKKLLEEEEECSGGDPSLYCHCGAGGEDPSR
jgi:hypothetical protein